MDKNVTEDMPQTGFPPDQKGRLEPVPGPYFKWALAGGGIVILIILGIVFNRKQILPFQKSPSSISKQTSQEESSGQKGTVPKPAPVKTTTARGIINGLNSDRLTLDAQGKIQIFNITGTGNFQRITSGIVEKGNARTAPTLASELKVGQEIIVIANIGSAEARDVYIIR